MKTLRNIAMTTILFAVALWALFFIIGVREITNHPEEYGITAIQ